VSFAIIRGSNGRRHDVDFGDAEIEVDVAIGSGTVQIAVEAIRDLAPSDKRRFATLCHHGHPSREARCGPGG
jgi:hypothetical protein